MEFKSGNVRLREFTEDDIIPMAKLANNEKISRNLRDAFPHPYTIEDAKYFVSKNRNQNPQLLFAIEFENKYVGNIGLLPGIDIYRKSVEIGYFIGEPYWNKGITTIAVNLITDYAFNLGFVRIYTGVFEYNKVSQRVLEKCGFQKEAVFKMSVCKNDQMYDEVRYAKIHPDYINKDV